MSTMDVDVPFVGPVVDWSVKTAKSNFVVRHLPESFKTLYEWAIELVLDAAALFAFALALGAAMYFNFPSFAALIPHQLGAGSVYWGYVSAVLGGITTVVVVKAVLDYKNARADVLTSKDARLMTFESMRLPALLVLLGFIVTRVIS